MANIADRAKGVSPSLTLEITATAKKMKAEGKPVISFGAGEPDFNTPDYIVEAAKRALDEGFTKYTPASGTDALEKAIVEKLRRDNGLEYTPQNIVVSNGAKHSLFNIFCALLNAGDEVIIPSPYWLTYPELVKLNEGVPVFVDTKPENDFKMTAAELRKAISPKTKALILNNPCNPTGAVYSESEIKSLAAVLDNTDIYVVSDEIYEKLSYDYGQPYSIAAYSDRLKEHTIVVNGVSKTYAMTGWRIGYTASSLEIAKAMSGIQSHTTSNPNSIAQYAAAEAYKSPKGEEFLSGMRVTFDNRRKLMIDKLAKIEEVSFIYPQGAFYVMVNIGSTFGKRTESGVKINGAHEFALNILSSKNVAVIPCESFGANEYIRLSYAISEENIAEGLDRIAAFIKSLK